MTNDLKTREDWPDIRDQWLDGLCDIPFLTDVATEFEIEEAFDILVDEQEAYAIDLPTQASLRFVAIKMTQVFREEVDEPFL
jgi:hypothetical protein